MLSKVDSVIQKLIIRYVKEKIKFENIEYRFIYNPKHIFESTLVNINKDKDIVLWNPNVAGDNISVVNEFKNSVVILEKQTLFVQKISELNPINENMAINNGFYLIYINPEETEITNNEWKLVVQEDQYLLSIQNLLELIRLDQNNLKNEHIDIPIIFDDKINLTKNQINLSNNDEIEML